MVAGTSLTLTSAGSADTITCRDGAPTIKFNDPDELTDPEVEVPFASSPNDVLPSFLPVTLNWNVFDAPSANVNPDRPEGMVPMVTADVEEESPSPKEMLFTVPPLAVTVAVTFEVEPTERPLEDASLERATSSDAVCL